MHNRTTVGEGDPGWHDVRRCRFGAVTVRETRYAPRLRMPRHAHPVCGFGFVLSGSYDELYGQASFRCSRPAMKFRPAGEPHVTVFGGEGAYCLTVDLEPSWLGRLTPAPLSFLNRPAFTEGDRVSSVCARLRMELASPDELSVLSIESLTMSLLAELVAGRRETGAPRPPRWLREARSLLQESFASPTGLSALASRVGVHPVHLAASFRRHFGASVGEYVRRLRVDRAGALLARGELPLAEVALATGFSSQSHLTRAFKRLIGETPGRYRRILASRRANPLARVQDAKTRGR
ncbi:MAG TPA: AraC family transcriptional regulator [Thermoanaerobaculia bacterium]|nr:AraC family transcriptional regulator [Thermoanaerobaculia bacterium]